MIETVLVKKYKESLEQKEQLQKTDASDMETVIPETERKEVKNKSQRKAGQNRNSRKMTRLGIKISENFIRFTMNWSSRIIQFTRKRNSVLIRRKNCLRSKVGLKEEEKRIAGRNR